MKRASKIACLVAVAMNQSSSAWACPLCKFALETNETEPTAYMISILFMMGMISTLFLSVGVLLWWVSKQEKMALNAAGYQHLFDNAGSQPYLTKAKAEH